MSEVPKQEESKPSGLGVKAKEDLEKLENFFRLPLSEIKKRMEVIRDFLDTIRGVKDVKGRLAPLSEPEGKAILTSARLTSTQAQGLANIHCLKSLYPEVFSPLMEFGEPSALATISIGGLGRAEEIALMSAFSGERLLRDITMGVSGLGVTDQQRKKAEKKGEAK